MISTLTIKDPNYPQKLKSRLSNSPNLQVLGETSLLDSAGIAIIGSRYTSNYSELVTGNFVQEFSKFNLTIISGLAPGVDSYAHKCALQNNMATIGILGFGFDYLKSFENYNLVKLIIECGGCVISPFDSYQKPEKFTFIERNKLIAALADALVVVEATIKSGTFYTVQTAVELDIPVFGIPGSIFSKNSRGTHSLIKSGAYLADSPNDVLTTLNFDKSLL